MTSWMTTEIAFGKMQETPVQDALMNCAMADAKSGTVDPNIALFSRNDHYEKTVLLLSPSASRFVALLPGDWTVSTAHGEHEWGVLYSNGATPKDLGLKSPSR